MGRDSWTMTPPPERPPEECWVALNIAAGSDQLAPESELRQDVPCEFVSSTSREPRSATYRVHTRTCTGAFKSAEMYPLPTLLPLTTQPLVG